MVSLSRVASCRWPGKGSDGVLGDEQVFGVLCR
jgi:hypothetical protein